MRNTVYEPPHILSTKPKLMIKELHRYLDEHERSNDEDQTTCAQLLRFLELRNDWTFAQIVLNRVNSLQKEISEAGATESRINFLKEEASQLRFKVNCFENEKLEQKKKLQNELLDLTSLSSEKKQSLNDRRTYLEQCEMENREKSKQIETLQDAIDISRSCVSQQEHELSSLEQLLSSQANLLETTSQEIKALNAKLIGEGNQECSPLEFRPRVISAREREATFATLIKQQRERNRQLRYEIMTRRKSIRVFCRIRCSFEPDEHNAVTLVQGSDTEVRVSKPLKTYKGIETRDEYFTLDKVFGPQHTNAEVFYEIEPLIEGALKGHNVCIFAYGQTSAGKSHTMISDDGITKRAVQFIFEELDCMDDTEFSITGNCVEVYLDHVNDLFSGLGTSSDSRLGATLEFRNSNDVFHALSYAQTRRKTISTKANASSSRSHFIFSIGVSTLNKKTGVHTNCVLRFIDLAGSERVFSDDPSRLQETKAINSSLSTLGTVIQALHNPGSHIPFRASKLTELLAPCLTDSSKVLMLVNVAPEKSHVNETLSSLRFAARANSTVLN